MNKRNCKIIAGIMTITFLSSVGGGVSYRGKAQSIGRDAIINYIVNKAVKNIEADKQDKSFNDNLPRSHNNPDDKIRVIVQLDDKAVLQKDPLKSSGSKNVKAEINTKQKEIDAQKSKQDKIIQKASQLKGAKIEHRYSYLVNGFSMSVQRGELDKIKNISGVKRVTEVNVYKQDMTSAKSLTQVYEAWKDTGLKGEGMVVSIIDTGIDYTHKDMKITDSSKEKLSRDNSVLNNNDPGKYYTDKVPYGYNFADRNQDIVDRSTSMHGMHVAGIVAANGSEAEVKKNKAIQGVAPEAQLLAMKVFSNSPDGSEIAYSDDIVAAIDASVAHGADVINMSIGSTAGFQDPEDPEQVAIKNAVDNGVLVVTASGNSYYSTYPNKYKGVVDTSTVDAPGTSKDALTVASYDNSNLICSALDYSTGKTAMPYLTSEINPVGVLNSEYEVVDCGLGKADELDGKDLTGKIALISRGEISFIDKKLNAQIAKAAGVIIYNSNKDETLISMATDPEVKIPAIFIRNSDGLKLKKAIDSCVKVSFKNKQVSIPNPTANDMSDFTSWGPTPNLDFKPQLSAPGGNIYSTVNNNQYEIMSGTSMATPHTSGAEALILQNLKNTMPDIQKRQLVDLAKATAIQTTKVEMDKAHPNVPYSPRRQGAGLLQLDNALKNKVLITDSNGNSTLALKQIGKKTEFELKLHNYGDKTASYNLDTLGGAYTEIEQLLPTKNNPSSMSYEVKIDGAQVEFDSKMIEVPAGGDAQVKVSINLPDSLKSEQFVEGYVRFISSEAGIPALNIPYIGFYGDWSKPLIIDSPMWKGNSVLKTTGIYGAISNDTIDTPIPLGIAGISQNGNKLLFNENNIAFSPNGDKLFDNCMPVLDFLRNSKNLTIQVLDSKKKVIRQLALEDNVVKDNYDAAGPLTKPEWLWDGTVYNAKKGKFVAAPEGQYYISITSNIDFEGSKLQKLVMPVKLDLTAPEITVVSPNVTNQGKYTLKWNVKDASGLLFGAQGVILNNKETPEEVEIKLEGGVYSCDINLTEGENNIKIAAVDSAGNPQIKEVTVNYDTTAPKAPKISLSTTEFTNKNVEVTLTSDALDSDMAAMEYSLDNNTWKKYSEPFEVEANTKIYARAIDAAGNISEVTQSEVKNIYKTAPEIIIKGIEDKAFYKDKVKAEVEVKDLIETTTTVKLDGVAYKGEDINAEGQHKLEVVSLDKAGNTASKSVTFIIDKTNPLIIVDGVEDGKFYKDSITPKVTFQDTNTSTLTMKLDNKEYKGETVGSEGTHTLEITVTDAAGNNSDRLVSFTIDKTPPVISISEVKEGETYKDSVMPSITVEDTNSDSVSMKLDGKEYKGGSTEEEGQHKLEVTAVDKAGNTASKAVNFTIDATAPSINIEGIVNGNTYNNKALANVTTDEGTLEVSLDGKPYNGEVINILGEHELTATAVDAVGHKTSNTVKFSIRAALDNNGSTLSDLVNAIAASNIDDIVVTLNNTTSIPRDFFESILDNSALAKSSKKLRFVVNSNGMILEYSFKLSEINKENIHGDVDLALNTQSKYKDAIEKYDFKAQIISFKDNGVLPAPFTVRVKLDASKIDLEDEAYFYYYNAPEEKIEKIAGPIKVDKDGYLEVLINHCSDYFFSNIYIEKQIGGAVTTDDQETNASGTNGTIIPKTGSFLDSSLLVAIGALIAASGLGLIIFRRKKKTL